MDLSVLECLGVELFLGVVGLVAEFTPNICSGHWPRPEGTCATGRTEFLGALVTLVPVTPQHWGRYCVLLTADPMILGQEITISFGDLQPSELNTYTLTHVYLIRDNWENNGYEQRQRDPEAHSKVDFNCPTFESY